MRQRNSDGKDDLIAEAIRAGKTVGEIRAELQVASKRITRIRKEQNLPALVPGPIAKVLRPRVIDVPAKQVAKASELQKELDARDELIAWYEKREYELLDLVANLTDDNIKLRYDLTQAQATAQET